MSVDTAAVQTHHHADLDVVRHMAWLVGQLPAAAFAIDKGIRSRTGIRLEVYRYTNRAAKMHSRVRSLAKLEPAGIPAQPLRRASFESCDPRYSPMRRVARSNRSSPRLKRIW